VSGRSWSTSRRELLAHLGLGLGCLPLLRATRSYAAPAPAPRRLVCVMQPFGYRPAAWLPAAVGPLGQTRLPDSSSPLQPFADALLYLPGLTNPGLRPGIARDLAYATLFSGVGATGLGDFPRSASPTVDQVVAAKVAQSAGTPLRSLALGVMVDVGRVVHRGRRCFWRGANAPVAPEESPHALFAALYTRPASAEAAQRLRMEQRSLLDYVGGELKQFGQRLGPEDRLVVDQHLAAIRDVELGLGALETSTCAPPELGPALDSHRRANFAPVAELQCKLMVAALTCDLTRVVTLQLGNALGSGIPFSFVPGMTNRDGAEWAAIAQAPAPTGAFPDRKRLIDKWLMGLFAKLLGMMAAGPAGATLLDQSAVLWGTPMRDGADGNQQAVPWLLAGKCGGYFKTGQVADSAGKPLHGVLAELCNAMEIPTEFFGDRTLGAPMAGLKA
jgi:hypothetical protein